MSFYDNTVFIDDKNQNIFLEKNQNYISYWDFDEDKSKITRVVGNIIYQFNIDSNSDINFIENYCFTRNKNI